MIKLLTTTAVFLAISTGTIAQDKSFDGPFVAVDLGATRTTVSGFNQKLSDTSFGDSYSLGYRSSSASGLAWSIEGRYNGQTTIGIFAEPTGIFSDTQGDRYGFDFTLGKKSKNGYLFAIVGMSFRSSQFIESDPTTFQVVETDTNTINYLRAGLGYEHKLGSNFSLRGKISRDFSLNAWDSMKLKSLDSSLGLVYSF